jgi:hypothetical protein
LNAGDDVKQKKPDPSIYVTAAKVISAREADIVELLIFYKLVMLETSLFDPEIRCGKQKLPCSRRQCHWTTSRSSKFLFNSSII